MATEPADTEHRWQKMQMLKECTTIESIWQVNVILKLHFSMYF